MTAPQNEKSPRAVAPAAGAGAPKPRVRTRAVPDDGMGTLDRITLACVAGGVLAALLLWGYLRAQDASNDLQAAALRDFRALPDGVAGDSVKLVARTRPGPPDIDAWFTLRDAIGSTAPGTRISLNQVWHQDGMAFRVLGRVPDSDTDLEVQIIRPGDSMHRAVDGARATIAFQELKALMADANARLRAEAQAN